MEIDGMKIILYVGKALIFSIKASGILVRSHPFVLVWISIILLLYRYFPALFGFLLSSSPVIIFTALLLGILLMYGEANVHEEEKTIRELSSVGAKNVRSEPVLPKVGSMYVDQREKIRKMPVKTLTRGEGRKISSRSKPTNYLPSIKDDEEEEEDSPGASSSSIMGGKRVHGKNKMSEIELLYQGHIEKLELSVAESLLRERKSASGEGLEAGIDMNDDSCEASSPTASVNNILPIIDELSPLLNSENPQAALRSGYNSDAVSSLSSADDESDVISAAGETENQEEEDDDDEGPEKDDGTEVVVKWTANDQKNVMDVGSSELEKNQRLENLIARRMARKRFENEKNLIDLHNNVADSIMEQLSGLQVQLQPKGNPFDLPYDSNENPNLPPIPGSAPSILQPRRNPFDLPEDTVGENSTDKSEKTNQQDFLSVPQRDIFFRRHESFSVGPSFFNEFKHERRGSWFRPYFVAERIDSVETGFATLQRQSSDTSDSKESSEPESDSASSVHEQEDEKELVEPGNIQGSHMVSPASHIGEHVALGSQTSEEVDSLDMEQETSNINIGDDHRTGTESPSVATETHPVADEIEENFDGTSSSSTSEVISEKSLKTSTGTESITAAQTRAYSPNASVISAQSLVPDSDQVSGRADDPQVAEPVYDSSPSAKEKSLSGDIFSGSKKGKASSNTSSSASEMHVETSEFGSPPTVERNAPSEDGATIGFLWVASPSLNFVEENESRSREVSVIREHDVIGMGFPERNVDFPEPIVPEIPKRITMRMTRRSGLYNDSIS